MVSCRLSAAAISGGNGMQRGSQLSLLFLQWPKQLILASESCVAAHGQWPSQWPVKPLAYLASHRRK